MINRHLRSLEKRLGPGLLVYFLVIVLMLAAAIYVRPAVDTTALGNLYARMAENPFEVIENNYVGFRILTPLISYLMGFRGQNIIITNDIFAAVLLALVFVYFRKRFDLLSDAFLAAVCIAFSMVTLATIYYGGYCDSLTYVIIFLMYLFRRKLTLFYALFFFGLLNRESIAFLIPWFLYITFIESKSRVRWAVTTILGLVITFGLFQYYRSWIGAQGHFPFRISYYLTPLLDDPLHWYKKSFTKQGLGLFTVFKALWIIPLVAVIKMTADRYYRGLVSIGLIFVCVWLQLFIAFDTSRMLTLGFMIMIISLKYILRTDYANFRNWIWYVVILNFLVPQFYTASYIIERMYSPSDKLLFWLILGQTGW